MSKSERRMDHMKKSAPFLILFAGILWGSMGVFVRFLNQYHIEAINIVAMRAWVTVAAMMILLFFYDRSLFRVRKKDIWCFIGTGWGSILFFNYCYFHTIEITSMSVAAVLLYSSPAFVLVLSFFLFQEKITWRKWLSLFLVVTGCAFVTGIIGNAQTLTGRGILTGLGAGFGYALYSVFCRFALERKYHSLTILFYTFVFAAVGIVPMADFLLIGSVTLASPKNFMIVIIFGLVSTVIPYLTYTLGLKYVENGKAAVIVAVEPVAATVLGFLLYGETLSGWNLIGMVLVLAAIVIQR